MGKTAALTALLFVAGCGRHAGDISQASDGGVDTAIEDGDGCRVTAVKDYDWGPNAFRCPCEVGKTCSYWDGKNIEITCEVKKVVAETVVRAARPGEVP